MRSAESREVAALAAIARLVGEEVGLDLSDRKYPMMRARLQRRLRALGLHDLTAYHRHLGSPDGLAERQRLFGALTTHVSGYFREPHHFDLLRQSILPPLAALARAGQPVRLWSAGTAAGQEAYSMAMVLLDAMPDAARWDIRVLATDIDAASLAQAERGEVTERGLAQIPPAFRQRFLIRSSGGLRCTVELRSLIRFRQLNLLRPFPMQKPFQAIFCRNVLIHLDTAARRLLCECLANALAPGGWLILGHAERPAAGAAVSLLGPAGRTAYRRRALEGQQ